MLTTPPPSHIIMQGIRTSVSAISLLLMSHSCHTNARVVSARMQHDTQLNADDLNAADLSDEDALYPKKALPDFTTQKSDDNSVASGDDSAGWEKEEDRVVNAFAAQAEAADRLEDISVDTPVKDLHEFMLAGGEEGNADGDVAPEFETRQVLLKKTNVKTLREIALKLNVGQVGLKEVLFNCIRDSPHVRKVSEAEFEYRHAKAAGDKIPTWVLLSPEDLPLVDGIDMATGAEKGFFGPTNKENAVGGRRTNFLTGEEDKVNQQCSGQRSRGRRGRRWAINPQAINPPPV